MNISRKKNSFGVCFWSVLLAVGLLMSVLPETAAAKSVYVVPGHHTGQFQAYNINPDGTLTYQATYGVTVNSPSGMAAYDDPTVNTVFITSEFSTGIHMFDGKNLVTIGTVTTNLPSNLAGIDVDEANNIVYTLRKGSRNLYICDFVPALLPAKSALQPRAGYVSLPGMSQGYGISFDDATGLLWVADAGNDRVRAYNPATWAEVTSESYTPLAPGLLPIDIDVDSARGAVYTVCMAGGGGTPGASTYLSRFDLVSRTEQSIQMGSYGVGVAADEVTGLVYVTCQSPESLNVWDPYASPPTKLQQVAMSGSGAPAGVVVGPGYNPLNLTKEDGLDDDDPDECVPVGKNIIYDICYDNTLNLCDVTNVTIVDKLPLEAIFVSATAGGVYDPVNHTVTWNIGTLPAGDPGACIQLVIKIAPGTPPGSNLDNACTINGAEPGTGPTTIHEYTDVCLNQPPDCDDAYADPGCLWPLNHKFVAVDILGVTDPDGDPVNITITGITSDEPTASDEGAGGAKHAPDASGVGTDTAGLRVECSGGGNGRVYEISFTAIDGYGGECEGSVIVCVPHDQSGKDCECIDDGQVYDATQIN